MKRPSTKRSKSRRQNHGRSSEPRRLAKTTPKNGTSLTEEAIRAAERIYELWHTHPNIVRALGDDIIARMAKSPSLAPLMPQLPQRTVHTVAERESPYAFFCAASTRNCM